MQLFCMNLFTYAENLQRPVQKDAKAIEMPIVEEKFKLHPRKSIIKPQGTHIELKPYNYLSIMQDIYYDYDYYKNKTIILEGMVTKYISKDEKIRAYFVYRNGPGCCDDDKWVGFLLNDSKGINFKQSDWVKVSGKPVLVEDSGNLYMFLDVETIKVLPDFERKQEIVYWGGEN